MQENYLSSAQPFNFKHGFLTFIRLIGDAHLIFQRIITKTDSDDHVQDWIILNDTAGFSHFEEVLSEALQKAKSEIRERIFLRPTLFDKILFMEGRIKELEGHMNMLTKTENGFSHAKFSFFNISKHEAADVVLTEADIQEHYKVMKQYSAELLSHYKTVKQIVDNSTHEDFRIVSPVPLDPWESSKQTPLAFFDYFFVERGYTTFYDDFFYSLTKLHEEASSFNSLELTITYRNKENGESQIYSYDQEFGQRLRKKLNEESKKSKTCIDSRIDECTTEAAVVVYLKILLNTMNYIYMELQKYEEARKHIYSTVILKGITRYVLNKYGSFDKELANLIEFLKPDNTPLKKEIPVTSEAPPEVIPYGVITGFKWLANAPVSTLYETLVKSCIISDSVKEENFRKAFTGKAIEEPLKIAWMKTVNNRLSKKLLLHFLKRLMELELIERVDRNQELYKKIINIFTDHLGKSLKNFEQTNNELKQDKVMRRRPTDEMMEVNNIIYTLKENLS